MKHLRSCLGAVGLGLGFLLAAGAACAQSHGYGFAGGAWGGALPEAGFRYGIGGAGAVVPHLTLGGEIGGISRGGTTLVVSGNIGVHLRRRVESGFDPFLTVGITGIRESGETGGYTNFGGGANYWLHRHFGLRGEIRTYPSRADLNGFSDIRFGICFR